MTGSATDGEELANSLYSDMFGLTERGGRRQSPLASYSGRGSLAGFLRASLAQRNVDRHRRTWRETELAGVQNGVLSTPGLFLNGARYDGLWDRESLESLLEARSA